MSLGKSPIRYTLFRDATRPPQCERLSIDHLLDRRASRCVKVVAAVALLLVVVAVCTKGVVW